MSSDKCTLISIVPFEINEFKPGLVPCRFKIPESDGITPQLLVISTAYFWVDIGQGRPQLKVPVPVTKLAAGLVLDFAMSQIGTAPDCMPGLDWIEGEISVLELKTPKYAPIMSKLQNRQRDWFFRLIKIADDDWQKTHKHVAISDTQRKAAKLLNYEREWTTNVDTFKSNVCPACTTRVTVGTIVCPTCHCILDEVKYKTMKFATAT